MYRLGTAERTAQGLVILRVDDPPDIGTRVITEDLDEIGTIVDVFGPVSSPYAAVAIDDDRRLATLLGDPLYAK